jgi:hypothetical protein
VSTGVSFVLGGTTANALANGIHDGVANAVGPIKIGIINPTYTASPCPKDKPIPGEKAMKGMRGLCVRVKAELAENSPKVRAFLVFGGEARGFAVRVVRSYVVHSFERHIPSHAILLAEDVLAHVIHRRREKN